MTIFTWLYITGFTGVNSYMALRHNVHRCQLLQVLTSHGSQVSIVTYLYITGFSGVNCEETPTSSTETPSEGTTAKPLSEVITDILGGLTGQLTTEQKQQLIAQIIQAILNQPASSMSSDAGAQCMYPLHLYVHLSPSYHGNSARLTQTSLLKYLKDSFIVKVTYGFC